MSTPTYEALRSNPELLEALVRRARRQRAEAVQQLLIEPLKALFRTPPKAAPALRNKPC